MEIRRRLKNFAEHIPYRVGKLTAHVPYRLRLGRAYSTFGALIERYERASEAERHEYVIARLNAIVRHAQRNIPFYQALYGRSTIEIKTLADFEALPIITKSDVREYTKHAKGPTLLNTGGSSGEPVSFYIDRDAWAREWAHMHFVWRLRGYKQTDLMATMLGKNLGERLFAYNAVHNEIKINPYTFTRHRAKEVLSLFEEFPLRFIQGYPSAIYNLFRVLEFALTDSEKALVRSKVDCCLFSSEYPLPYMVTYLTEVWGLDYISWYGHSEMCILAYDNDNSGKYRPFATYGFAEEVGGALCGTSFHNYSMPLIRYSTGDIVESRKTDMGTLDYFMVKEGREGDFVDDKDGNRIPLTSMVFGRHHTIFNIADYVQILQTTKGAATFYITFGGRIPISINEARSYFDLSNLDLDFAFVFSKAPVLTRGGKLKLKLVADDVRDHPASLE